MKTLNIPTTSGHMDVPVHYEEGCHNLCVTMTHFGNFEITHIESGRKLYGDFERAASATAEMLRLELAFIEIGINEPKGMEEIQELILNNEQKIDRLGDMRVIEYIKVSSGLGKITGEFPWESFEDSPFGKIEELRKEFNGK